MVYQKHNNTAMKKRPFKVRFHLGKGYNYKKWRVEDTRTKEVTFYDPKDYSLQMNDCKLYNQKAAADKIFKGGNKTVCAVIRCESVVTWIFSSNSVYNRNISGTTFDNFISYNPREKPFWCDSKGQKIDGSVHEIIMTKERRLYKNIKVLRNEFWKQKENKDEK